MGLNKKPYKGCRDFFPKDMRVRQYLNQIMQKSAESYGFEPYDGPLLEEVELYKAKSGEELINDQIYSFHDRGERFVAIRPEMTPTLARMIAASHRQTPKPIRWYSIPNLMRYENPQKGRLREHWQFNVDIFGAPDNTGEKELLKMLIHFLENLGADSSMFSIQINDRQIVDSFFQETLEVTNEEAYKLYKILDRSKKISKEKLDAQINELQLEANKVKALRDYLLIKDLDALQEFSTKYNLKKQTQNLFAIYNTLKNLNLEKYLIYDPTIVRGLDYYTGIVFEVFDKHPDNRRAIAGGGAYKDLLKIFNEEPLPGIGFGLGDVTLKDFLEVHKLLPDFSSPQFDLMICPLSDDVLEHSFKTALILRKAGLKIDHPLSKIKMNKVFKQAQAKGHKFIAVIGEDEAANNEIQLKNLETREAKNFKQDNITEIKKFIEG